MYRPSGDSSPLITITNLDLDSVCGNMQYILDEESEGGIMSRPVGDSYFTTAGTNHILKADERNQIGHWKVKIRVRTDLDILSTTKYVEFELEILDCKVNYFETGK